MQNVLANILGQQVFLHWNAHCHGNCPYSKAVEGALCLELSGDPPWEIMIMVLPMDRSCSVWICSCVKEEEGVQDGEVQYGQTTSSDMHHMMDPNNLAVNSTTHCTYSSHTLTQWICNHILTVLVTHVQMKHSFQP